MTVSDEELMTRVREGDGEAFDELLRRHQRGVIHFFHGLAWDHHRAEDLAQETFVRVFRSREAYEPKARFQAWLYRIARNLWVDTMRRAALRPRETSLDRPAGGEASPPLAGALAARAVGPDHEAEFRETCELLQRGIAALPEEQRVVFHLGETLGLPYAEVSQMLDIPVGTVKSRMHAAMLRLRAVLRSGGLS
jgi:RNA polymerase sigma-70 factor (ECF subfamily)